MTSTTAAFHCRSRRSDSHRNQLPARRSAPTPSWIALVLLLWAASPALAGDRFYVGLEGGQAGFDRDFEGAHTWNIDDEVSTLAVSFGADLHRNLGVEVGYQAANGFSGSGLACFSSPEANCVAVVVPVEADLDVWSLALVPKKRFGKVTILGRVGAAYYEQEVLVTDPTAGSLGQLTGTEWAFGAGARLELTSRLELLLDYDSVAVGLDTLSLGLGYRF